MNYEYKGKDLEECLLKAEKDLKLSRKQFQYEIIKQEKGFFKRKTIINVIKDEVDLEAKDIENSILVENNEIFLNLKENEERILYFDNSIKVFVNDKEVSSPNKVASDDVIKYEVDKIDAKRKLNIELDKNKMNAFITIKYVNEQLVEVDCINENNNIKVITRTVDGEKPPKYTKEEIKTVLNEKGIVYGILDEVLDEIEKLDEVEKVAIAKGVLVKNDENDEIKIKFQGSKKSFKEDTKEKVNYRDFYTMPNVIKNEIIAEVIIGSVGHNGRNILGVEIEKKDKKELNIVAAEGCELKGNKIIATIDGKPSVKGNMFSVHKLLEVANDVTMKSGNVLFVGDVKINGSVKDGMTVKAGNRVEVNKNVESAKIIADGDVSIGGNVINSEIIVGGKDIYIKEYVEVLEDLEHELEILIKALNEIREKHIISEDRKIGDIIRLLLESKFKNIIVNSKKVIENVIIDDEETKKIKKILKEKIIGNGSLGIKYLSELYELIKCIDEEVNLQREKMSHPVDVYLNYSQDTKIKATGNIFITGKGQYISNLSTLGRIEFLSDGAISRGGTLTSGKDIKAKVVGSVAGVTTILEVPKTGVITADIAYQNSVFIVGKRKYTLNRASKDIKVYLDDKGEIKVDKFVL